MTDSESRSEYYSVVEALWQLNGSHDRKRFLEKAQKLWSEKYSKDSGAREDLRQRGGPGPSDRPLMRSFVSKEEARRRIEETAACDTSLNVDWECEHSLYIIETSTLSSPLDQMIAFRKSPY